MIPFRKKKKGEKKINVVSKKKWSSVENQIIMRCHLDGVVEERDRKEGLVGRETKGQDILRETERADMHTRESLTTSRNKDGVTG